MAKIDENQEVIAQIRMAVDNYDNAQQLEEFKDADDNELPVQDTSFSSGSDQPHWKVGSPEHSTTSKILQDEIFKTRTICFF